MGASVSKNINEVVTKTVATVSTDIVQNTEISQDSSQIISVSDVDGDVIISGNKFTQEANINMESLLDALSSDQAQQELATLLAQEAKSLTSGINIGQFSYAENNMNTLLEATSNLLTTIGQNCKSQVSQTQKITVERIIGDVYIQNNVFSQMAEIIQKCSESVVSENQVTQDFTVQMSQLATAESKGVSALALALAALGFLAVPVLGGVFLGKSALKIIFPILIIVGIVFLALYFINTEETMSLVGYSNLIKNSGNCLGQNLTIPGNFSTIYEVSEACKSNKSCKAFDFDILGVDSFGNYESKDIPTINFYSKVSSNCQQLLSQDDGKIFYLPNLFVYNTTPELSGDVLIQSENSDAYLNVSTGDWYQKENSAWVLKENFSNDFNRISWGFVNPTISGGHSYSDILAAPQEGDVYVSTSAENPAFWIIYRYDLGFWVQIRQTSGPGRVAKSPSELNTSGFKVKQRKTWLMILGIFCIILGVVGFVIMQIRKKKIEN